MHELLPLDAATLRSFCTFRLGTRLYGIDVAQVREVSPLLAMTAIPQVPPAIRGLFNLRSRIYLGVDMRPLLGLSPTVCTGESRLIILKPGVAPDMGMLVETGGDIVHTPADLIDSAGAIADAPGEKPSSLIAGVCKLQADLMMIVDLTRLPQKLATLLRSGGVAEKNLGNGPGLETPA